MTLHKVLLKMSSTGLSFIFGSRIQTTAAASIDF